VPGLVVGFHQPRRTAPPQRTVRRVQTEPAAGGQDPKRLPRHGVPVRLADVLNGLAAVYEIERSVVVAPEVDHGVEGELHGPELGQHGLTGRATLVEGVTL